MNEPLSSPRAMSLKDRVYLALLTFFSWLPLGFLQHLGGGLGRLVALNRQSRPARVIRRNLELCYPTQSDAWRESMVTANLVHTGKVAMEFAKAWGRPPEWSLQHIGKVHGEDIFHEATAAGHGTIAIVPHFGSWEIMNAWLSLHVEPVIMYKPGKDAGVNAFVLRARGRLRATMVPTDESGVRAIFRVLRKNGFTAILPDHLPESSGGVQAPFFGIETPTGTIVPKLIQRTGSRAVMMYCERRGDGFEIHFTRPDPEIYSDDLLIATTALNRSVENVIAHDPVQYQWSYKRFRNCATLPDPYA
ncbi:MAG: lysophospholipid acyltransferase family protein [Moraxellaceae bacterium]|nr:lysophospholipid acyltransferase family protein [Moraxellaceae bacterium]